jgi:Holliday junction resolvase RusA-like endonuclease
MVEIILEGIPRPLKRPRFTKTGRVYNEQSSEMLINFLDIKKQWGTNPLLVDPIHIDIEFIFPIPSSYSVLKQRNMKKSFHKIKPDIDNLVKKCLDEMTGACYTDDNIIASIAARKIYGSEGKTIINIKKL